MRPARLTSLSKLTASPRISRALRLGCAFLAAAPLCAEEPAPPLSVAASIAQEVRGIFQKCRSAVVRIEASDDLGDLAGSGFFIDPNGTLYTSYTVGGTSSELTVTWDGDQYTAQRLVADERSGVAILKIEPNAAAVPFLVLGRASDLGLGDPIVAIGYPMDLPVSPSWGTLAGFDMKYLGCYFATRHLRANVAVQRGEGGAPLINLRGEAVGLLVSTLDNGSACYSLPIEAAEHIRKDFVRHGRLRPGWLGIGCASAATPVDGSSARVDIVTPGSPGALAGVKPGDVLLQVGDHPIAAAEDVLDASFFIAAEDEVKLRLARGTSQLEVTVLAVDAPRALKMTDSNDLRGARMKLDR